MTYPPPHAGPYAPPNPVPQPPARPVAAVMAAVLGYAAGAVGLVLLIWNGLILADDPGTLEYLGLQTLPLYVAPALQLAAAVCGGLVLRGSGGARVAFFVLTGLAAAMCLYGVVRHTEIQIEVRMSAARAGMLMAFSVLTLAVEAAATALFAAPAVGRWLRATSAGRRSAPFPSPAPYAPHGNQPPHRG